MRERLTIMKRNLILLIIAIILIAIITSCSTTSLDTISFTIRNSTGGRVTSGYIRLPGTSNWENIFTASLTSGESRVVTASVSALDIQGRADIQLRAEGGVLYTTLSQSIYPETTVTMRPTDIDPSSPMSVTIQNYTGSTISEGYAKQPSATSWVLLFETDIANNSSLTVTIPNTVINTQKQVDLQLRTMSGVLYTKSACIITYNGTISFTTTDLTLPEVTIINNTTDIISQGFIKHPTSSSWSPLFETMLAVNSSHTVTIPATTLDNDNRTDLQLCAGGVILYTKLLCSITHNGEIVFTTADDLDPNSPRTVTLQNSTGVEIAGAYIRQAGSTNWGSSFFLSPLGIGQLRQVTIPRAYMDSQYYSDIQLRATNGATYTRSAYEIIHNSVITFSVNEKDNY